ncbi:MAG: SDR family NAD(P)-dependent oxidoreductase [Bacteroidia bacterium]|nr:SDR family NAD(P)-dependent oxidoreductase [Bacteroidia bacterium]
MTDKYFHHKVVLITGSSQGIGKTTAALMLKAGAKVVINGRDENRLHATYEELSKEGEVIAVSGDMSRWEEVQNLIAQTINRFGRIDVLICNAGIKFEDSFRRTTPETLQKIWQVNFLGKILPVKAAFESLIQTQGSIILIGSLAGLYGLPGAGIYSAAKMALAAICQSLEAELTPHNVHIGLIYVGLTENEKSSSILNGAGEKQDFPDRNLPRQSREVVAKAIIRMIQKRLRRKVMTPIGIALDILTRISPGLLRLVLRKRVRQIKEIL